MSIFSLEASKGHLGWKVTELEKRAKVGRTLIYRYFGHSKAEIFKTGLEAFLDDFYGFSDGPNAFANFSNRIEAARLMMAENRDIVIFYQKWRLIDSPIRNILMRAEEKFRKKLKKIFPGLTEEDIVVAHACIHGLVTSPFLSPKEAKLAFKSLTARGLFSEA